MEMERVRQFLEQPGADQLMEEILDERWMNIDDEPVSEAQLQVWQDKFNRKVAGLEPLRGKKFRVVSLLKYAAAAALIVTVGGYSWHQMHKADKPVAMLESATTAGKLLKVLLPDSTVVYLNAESRLQYPEAFTGDNRTVSLQGEAFFEVKQDGQHPFFVTTDKLRVQVLGTSFNVRSYHDDEAIAVAVATGKVSVTVPGQNAPASILLPDHELIYGRHSGQLQVAAVDAADSRAWEKGSFVFNYETLENITKRLSRWYGVEFVFGNPALLQKRFKLKMKNEKLKNIMEALSIAGDGFQYEINGKEVTIK